MEFNPLTALSPLDGRYAGKVDALREHFSEFGLIRARLKVEIEWLKALAAEPHFAEIAAFSASTVAELDALGADRDSSRICFASRMARSSVSSTSTKKRSSPDANTRRPASSTWSNRACVSGFSGMFTPLSSENYNFFYCAPRVVFYEYFKSCILCRVKVMYSMAQNVPP